MGPVVAQRWKKNSSAALDYIIYISVWPGKKERKKYLMCGATRFLFLFSR
jgi:hypothetical protein